MTNAEEILDFQTLVRMVPIADSIARYVVELRAGHASQQRHCAGFREAIRQLRRQRARRAVHRAGGQGARPCAPPLSRVL